MNKLRIGVILPYVKVPAWVVRILEQIRDSSYAEVAAMMFTNPAGERENPEGTLYTSYFQNDQRLFPSEPNPWVRKDVRQILQNTQLLGESLEERISRLKGLRSDVLLNLSLEEFPKALLGTTRFGVWSLRCNDKRVTTGTRFGWFEVLHNELLLHCEVESHRKESMQVVARSVMSAHPYSFTQNQSMFLWRMSDVLPRALKQLHTLGEQEFFSQTKAVNAPDHYPNPTTVQLFELARKQVANAVMKSMQRNTGMLMTGIHLDGNKLDWGALKPQEPPRGVSWSDPFILKKQNTSYLFFTEESHAKRPSRILCTIIESDGNISEPLVALDLPYSLSYPFIFEYRGEFYMIPSTEQNHTVDVYHCRRFPDQWEHYKTILRDVGAANATLIEFSMRWWLFAGVGDELHLYYSDDPLSENWTPHPMNPIVSDVRSAHPAGRIFRRDGGLVRPARDISLMQGRVVSLNRITKLTTNEYEEELLERVEPQDGVLAVNTYNNSGDFIVMDALLKR